MMYRYNVAPMLMLSMIATVTCPTPFNTRRDVQDKTRTSFEKFINRLGLESVLEATLWTDIDDDTGISLKQHRRVISALAADEELDNNDSDEEDDVSRDSLDEFYEAVKEETSRYNRLGSLQTAANTSVPTTNYSSVLVPAKYVGSCGIAAIKPTNMKQRIVGGEMCRPHSWPWTANFEWHLIEYPKSPWIHVCGATLISSRFCVTAAHCVFPERDVSLYRITLGQHDLLSTDGAEAVYGVKRVYTHEDYSTDADDDDIALIELDRDVQYTGYISPVCIADSSVQDDVPCIAVGWGSTLGVGNPNVLNQVIVPKLSNTKCKSWYRNLLGPNMICCGYPDGGHDSCSGDSGGPLVAQTSGRGAYYLYGLTSWGIGCGEQKKPGVYTDIAKYRDWIRRIAKV